MQLTLLLVNFFLITIISREYGAETYGEYASSKSLSVLIGTATVMSLALVSTKYLAQKNENSKLLFSNSYYIIIRNFLIALLILFPVTFIFQRDVSMTALFLIGFTFNEMIHVALAYFQAKGDFVTSSKQILIRTIIYGLGASTKGNVLLQNSKVDNKLLSGIFDVNKAKFNKFTPHSKIKILDEEKIRKTKVDYILLLIWHFKGFVIKKIIIVIDNTISVKPINSNLMASLNFITFSVQRKNS